MVQQLPSSAASPLSLAGLDESPTVASDEEIVATFDSLLLAELVRGRLEASGIGVRLQDAHTIGLASHLAQAVGGVKVVVAKSDAEDARALLATPAVIDDDADPRPTRREQTVDDVARWAFRLSLMGVAFPIVGQIASLVFALQAIGKRRELTRRGRVHLGVALAVDGAMILLVAASLG
ncbi:MAG: DUF2007 domain-containing protein [Deltaproteobacteria bacterium]|nr:DUF2007 domain-containing protein [Deltaproteobacteria bacterium]